MDNRKKRRRRLSITAKPNVATDGIEVTSIFVDVKEFNKIQYSKGDKPDIEFRIWDLQDKKFMYPLQ